MPNVQQNYKKKKRPLQCKSIDCFQHEWINGLSRKVPVDTRRRTTSYDVVSTMKRCRVSRGSYSVQIFSFLFQASIYLLKGIIEMLEKGVQYVQS